MVYEVSQPPAAPGVGPGSRSVGPLEAGGVQGLAAPGLGCQHSGLCRVGVGATSGSSSSQLR